MLVVDDDPLILKALNRTFSLNLPDWEIVPATSGELAVSWLTRTVFDLVLTDMQMPGMDGSVVLKMARQLQPQAVRIVLSGHSPLLRIMGAEGDYHRFLTKPVDPDQLMAILRSFILEGAGDGTRKARELVTGLMGIPCIPSNLARLEAALELPEPSLGEVLEVVSQDLGMAAKILKLVNTAYLSFGRSIVELDKAIESLGLDIIQELVLSRGAMAPAENLAPEGLSLEALWAHSRVIGLRTRDLIYRETGDRHAAAEAYTAGLLHDVGMVVLANDPSCRYRSILEQGRLPGGQLIPLEQEQLGTDHVQVGVQLLNLWGLPESISSITREHHACRIEDHSSMISLALQVAHSPVGDPRAADQYFEQPCLQSLLPQAEGTSLDAVWQHALGTWKDRRGA